MASSQTARLDVRDSSGTWEIVLEAGSFRFSAHGSNTGWYRLRRRTIRNTVAHAYEEWARWRERHGDCDAPASAATPQQAVTPSAPPAVPAVTAPTIEQIIGVVAARYGLQPQDLTTPCRAQPAVTARQLAMRLSREMTDHSLQEIGRAFNREHTTVMHALKATEGMAVGDIKEALRAA
jgi:hypothetical protein